MSFQETLASCSKRLLLYAYLAILGIILAASNLYAQGDSSLWGSVSDASDAGISGATVIITNLETGTQRSLVTDDSGRFNAPALPVGSYEIAASKTGFRTDRRTSITLVVGQREEVNLKLQIGDVRQTVEVPAVPT